MLVTRYLFALVAVNGELITSLAANAPTAKLDSTLTLRRLNLRLRDAFGIQVLLASLVNKYLLPPALRAWQFYGVVPVIPLGRSAPKGAPLACKDSSSS